MRKVLIFATVMACMGPWASAQTAWDVLHDIDATGAAISESACGIVNATSAATGLPIRLLILADTAELMIVSRTDTILSGTFVDLDNFVSDNGAPTGVIEYVDDGDGFRTVWWVSLDGTVVEVDPFTGEAIPGTRFPEEFTNVACDACEFVDFPPADVCDVIVDDGPDLGSIVAPIVVNLCGLGIGGPAMLAMTFCGFLGLRFTRRWM